MTMTKTERFDEEMKMTSVNCFRDVKQNRNKEGCSKELGLLHIIITRTLTAHNICLTHITTSFLIYAYALGCVLYIKV